MADIAQDPQADAPPQAANLIVFPFAPPAPDASVVEVAPGLEIENITDILADLDAGFRAAKQA